ncbi:uncharacterized protein LOC133740606 [Rosa rugosa]|uniref:uncharacterized protein LOC133740606 n=1 Tax=Rosa rugosa TaxID=74645 RepID=UPI002B406701|nr:uncharacterized protein LOC133740606 [Rosa rugosa]
MVQEHEQAKAVIPAEESLVAFMVKRFNADIPTDEPKLNLDDDMDETEMVDTSCNMVYVLPAKYALPVAAQEYVEADAIGEQQLQITSAATTQVKEAVFLETEDVNSKGFFMSFTRPTPAMVQHMRPLYITAEINGTKVWGAMFGPKMSILA